MPTPSEPVVTVVGTAPPAELVGVMEPSVVPGPTFVLVA